MKSLINQIGIHHFANRVRKRLKNRFVSNVFQAAHERRALLSYISFPFFRGQKESIHHTNVEEAWQIAGILDSLGFVVDVCGYDNLRDFSTDHYDLVFGFGGPYNRALLQRRAKQKFVFYATGAHSSQRDSAEWRRAANLYARRGRLILPRRQKPFDDLAATYLSDLILCTGNEWTASTYRNFGSAQVERVRLSLAHWTSRTIPIRNWSEARHRFVWFGGNGLLHKGLDLTIEAFRISSSLQLDVFGPRELDLLCLYKDAVNVHYGGFVNPAVSEVFWRSVAQSGFVILPSCSEAGAVSVLNMISLGLIPVVTRETSVDIPDRRFLLPSDPSPKQISDVVQEISRIPQSELESVSTEIACRTRRIHSFDSFREDILSNLARIVLHS